MQDLPNAALIIGYTNISWTLGADVSGILFCRLLKFLEKRRSAAVIPRVPKTVHLEQRRMSDLNSTYISKADDELPKTAHEWPWQPRKTISWKLSMQRKIGSMNRWRFLVNGFHVPIRSLTPTSNMFFKLEA